MEEEKEARQEDDRFEAPEREDEGNGGGGAVPPSLQVGQVVEGIVTRVMGYGAVVKLPEGKTGLLHISQIADEYVRNIRDYINPRDRVRVKIIGIHRRGKYDYELSIKALPPEQRLLPSAKADKAPEPPDPSKMSLEEKIRKFLKESQERIADWKRSIELRRRIR